MSAIQYYEDGKAISGDAPQTKASGITFDNTNSDLVSEDVESAIKEVNGKSAKSADLTSISESGTIASQAISAGTYFYLNGVLVRAKTAIASGATFTLNTNYEVITAGGLNAVNYGSITTDNTLKLNVNITSYDSNNPYYCPCDGYVLQQGTGIVTLYTGMGLKGNSASDWVVTFVKKGCKVVNSGATYVYFQAMW